RRRGPAGLVTTSSIAEGDTRKSALVWVRQNDGQIYRAFKKESWPGQANVDISRIHIAKGFSIAPCVLGGERVPEINSFLNAGSLDYEPFRLKANEDKCCRVHLDGGEYVKPGAVEAQCRIGDRHRRLRIQGRRWRSEYIRTLNRTRLRKNDAFL